MSGPAATASVLVLVSLAALRAGAAGFRRAAVSARVASLSRRRPGDPRSPHAGAARQRALAPPAWLGPRLLAAGIEVDPTRCWTAWMAVAGALVAVAVAGFGAGAAVLVSCSVVAGPALAWRRCPVRWKRWPPASGQARRCARPWPRRLAPRRAAWATTWPPSPWPPSGAPAWSPPWRAGPSTGLCRASAWWSPPCASASRQAGAAARALDGVAGTLRQRLAAAAEAHALATQARVSAAVIAAAPVAFAVLAAVTDPGSAGFLLRTPSGLVLLSAGLALDAAGALWMARLTRVQV